MAVLVEAISVIIRADILHERFPGGWEAFRGVTPNKTLCADGELIRVGFMSPSDVEAYVNGLERHGIKYKVEGKAGDLVVIDQLRGPMIPCDWVEYGQVNIRENPKQLVSAARLSGSALAQVITPDEWRYEQSLSSSFGFIPTKHVDKNLRFLRREDNVDVYMNALTGREVYIGRTGHAGSGPDDGGT